MKDKEKIMNKCQTCWKDFIWACPLSSHHPKNIISCSAYEPTAAYLKEQKLINGFIQRLKSIKCHKERDDRGYLTFKCEKNDIEIIISEYEKELDERNEKD